MSSLYLYFLFFYSPPCIFFSPRCLILFFSFNTFSSKQTMVIYLSPSKLFNIFNIAILLLVFVLFFIEDEELGILNSGDTSHFHSQTCTFTTIIFLSLLLMLFWILIGKFYQIHRATTFLLCWNWQDLTHGLVLQGGV